ncbi:ribosomal protein S18 acetylase RimI-like enzyme [Paenibacillus taihuensis]|uniref:Ribosomal protein S18 acetylase RimI-like enzyme n=1 Tax=Paenibacillus taihuensis TaxID=1156355 RepID=A0A3D9SPV3_9BACL|nr:GNAT family N-acetyltransferase [Paenibacillus taihuensis]REE94604.1 ribosomal protein S18 acetylase RimI-like enzyme [Paenibacillus taihuensis]
MISFIPMSKLSPEQLVTMWNRGFEGYFSNMTLGVDRFIARAGSEGLSLEHSIAAYDGEEPVGFVMNGFRTIEGKKVAWNGGTGISPSYRGQGHGKLLMQQNVQIYREQGVDIALLEAMSQNEPAIKLYTNTGYHITERLVGLQQTGSLQDVLVQPQAEAEQYSLSKVLPIEVKQVSYYHQMAAWQTQWGSLRDGECLFVTERSGETDEPIGYALFRRNFDAEGNLASIVLFQCEASPDREDAEAIMLAALAQLYMPEQSTCRRIALNLRDSNETLIALLERLGFSRFMEQVHMELRF